MVAGLGGPAGSDGGAVAAQPDAGLGREEGLEAVEGCREGVLWVGQDDAGVSDGRVGDGVISRGDSLVHIRMGGETDGGMGDDADTHAAAAQGSEESLVGVLVGVDGGSVE